MIALKPSPRGLIVGLFKDRDGRDCVIQEASTVSEQCLWLGVDCGFDGEDITGARMHLNKALALELLPLLRHFARTGTLGHDDPSQRFQIGTWVIGVGPQNKGIYGRVTEAYVGTYLKVQDNARVPPAGQIVCSWNQADLIWDIIEGEQHGTDSDPTFIERILGEDPHVG